MRQEISRLLCGGKIPFIEKNARLFIRIFNWHVYCIKRFIFFSHPVGRFALETGFLTGTKNKGRIIMKKRMKNSGGFTLIEIIAVLIILGILAAVALPKYFDLQQQAADKVAEAGLAAGYSALSLGYAANKLGATNAPASPSAACTGIKLEGKTISSIGCTGDAWGNSGDAVPISVAYNGGTATTKTGSWITP